MSGERVLVTSAQERFALAGRPSALGAAGAALAPRRDVAHAHFRLSDPGPLAARAIFLGRRALGRRGGG
jgi:hypothetical protein